MFPWLVGHNCCKLPTEHRRLEHIKSPTEVRKQLRFGVVVTKWKNKPLFRLNIFQCILAHQFYYDDDAPKSKRRRRSLLSAAPPKCVACETRHKKERPTPEQFRKHLRSEGECK